MFGPKMRGITILLLALGLLACRRSRDDNPSAGSQAPPSTGSGVAQTRLKPPYDLKTPPADAIKTASGLTYKKIVTKDTGPQPKRNDTVLLNITSWKQNGDTIFTNAGRNDPRPMNLSQAAPAFVEALPLLRQGEKAMLWVPGSIGYKTPPTSGQPETLVHEVELTDIQPAPLVPDDVAKPPDGALATPSGLKYVVVRPGTGTEKARWFDSATFDYTAWDATGRMVETTEQRGDPRAHPVNGPIYKQSAGMSELLVTMVVGERARFWVEGEKMQRAAKRAATAASGLLCYEVQLTQVTKAKAEPPPPPPDVAGPPPGTKRTAKGVYYRLLKGSNSNERPEPGAVVKVNYTGWTTDGRMFDSSVLKGEPAHLGLNSVIAGWADGIPLMQIGERMRFWIPEDLAYRGAEGKPQGMLVFDIELVAIVPPTNR